MYNAPKIFALYGIVALNIFGTFALGICIYNTYPPQYLFSVKPGMNRQFSNAPKNEVLNAPENFNFSSERYCAVKIQCYLSQHLLKFFEVHQIKIP